MDELMAKMMEGWIDNGWMDNVVAVYVDVTAIHDIFWEILAQHYVATVF